eukprot:CAMPEP_0174826994 /NCGR_PEP_ID=MMETSP1114-20130205/394_1 /TAXON_ID=312471 /ORGANISM="Neobodo designis, Strain CCAP 1951/1" /LENGTH=459 /DNA_ID=CAMNT_0016060581 /DNA_START=176 /DNA_END=1555 /DNA_ORIENTATION=+
MSAATPAATNGPFAAVLAERGGDAAPTILKRPGGASPTSDDDDSLPRRRVTVPISHPRYERKTRLNRTMAVTDSASEDTGRSPADMLLQRTTETLRVRQGPVTHQESIKYQAFACYRHGSRQVHTQSVGYSSDGDLVLMRRDVSESESGTSSMRRTTVDAAVCLNPRARPIDPKVNGEEPTGRWERRLRRLPKYPGVRCPKNRKTRNRLINDHLAVPSLRKQFDATHEESDPEGLREPAAPHFEALPEALDWVRDTTERAEAAALGRFGADKKPPVPKQLQLSTEDGAFRFMQLPGRLKSELRHAMTTDFMPGFIADVEQKLEALVVDDQLGTAVPAVDSLRVPCRDGYGRLITHGIAGYYKLVSTSIDTAEGRVTQVSLPKKRVPLPDQRLTSFLRGERPGDSPVAGPTSPPMLPGGADSDEEQAQSAVLGRRKRFRKRTVRRFGGLALGEPIVGTVQ